MIRRSTLLFLTCLAALSSPALRAKSAAAIDFQLSPSNIQPAYGATSTPPLLIAQATGETSRSELGIGAKGGPVKELQTRLERSGYYDGPIDSIYGLATQRAVKALQADAGLTQTGSINEETYQKLRALSDAPDMSASDPAGGTTVSAPASETAPTNSELPAAESNSAAEVVPEDEGGSGKVFGIGLGIVAVLASFGIGFFLANRDKASKSDEGDWGEIEPDIDQPGRTALPLSPAASQSNSHSSSRSSGQSSGLNATGNSLSSSGVAPLAGGAMIATTNAASLQANGQMGGTTPLGQTDIVEGLVSDLRNPDPAKRRKAIWELGQRGNSLAMQPLVDSMIDADSKEKSLVLAALSEIGIRSLKPMSRALAIALQDDNPEVRKNAIRDLTRVYDLVVQISQMLGHATEDEDPEVRQTATWALDQLNRIRRSQDIDANVRTFSGGNAAPPIDLLSSEASLRRSQQGL